MADELDIIDDLDLEGEERGRSGVVMLALVAIIGLAGGGFLGTSTLGPKLAPILAERAANPKPKDDGHGGGKHGGEAPSALHVIDNLVVNPARSGGTRFLLVSIAVEATEAHYTAQLAARDVELRDALIMVLGAKSVDELTDVSLRPDVNKEVMAALERVMGHGVIHRIYIPQFVIQ
ncbi:MAG: flagellar basal body-associated FliL family protein [Longimicrobiales bacterium]